MRSGLFVIAMLTVVFCAPVLAYDWTTNPGTGDPNDPYQISEPNHLMSIGIDPNLMDNYFVLTADLDMSEYSGTQFNIIGNINTPFVGGFDGKGHTLSNLTHTSYDQSDVGLFGVIGQEAAIEPNVLPYVRNVTLADPNITTGGLLVGYTGAIAAVLRQGSIEHCSVSGGQITGGHSMGAIAGAVIDEGSVKHCFVSDSDISGTFSIGGIAGYYTSSGNIDSCGYSGDVAGTNYVGGIIGEFHGDTIRKCCSKGTVTGNYSIGGLVGYVGFDCNILNNYSQANVLSEGVNGATGGLVGTVGGGSYFSRCYAAGSISSDDDIGGFIGLEHNSTDYNDCFWDIEKNPLLDDVGNVGDVTEITGESTDNMQTQSTFSGWDFVGESVNGENDIWRLCESEPNYPRLSWEFARNGDFACGDGVDMLDLQALAQNWLAAADSTPTTFNYACDANGDEKIDMKDYAVLGKNWTGAQVLSSQVGQCTMEAMASGQSRSSLGLESESLRFTATVQGRNILFEDDIYANCCIGGINLNLVVQGNRITLEEWEIPDALCVCMCTFPTTATLGSFTPGEYTFEVLQFSSDWQGGYYITPIGETPITIE